MGIANLAALPLMDDKTDLGAVLLFEDGTRVVRAAEQSLKREEKGNRVRALELPKTSGRPAPAKKATMRGALQLKSPPRYKALSERTRDGGQGGQGAEGSLRSSRGSRQ